MTPCWRAAPLLACGLLKIAYDLALWRSFRGLAAREVDKKSPPPDNPEH